MHSTQRRLSAEIQRLAVEGVVTLQISVSEFGILKPCTSVLGTASKTDRTGRYGYPLNTLNFNTMNANASPFQKPAAVNC